MITINTPLKIDCRKYESYIGLDGFDIYVNAVEMHRTAIEAQALEDAAYWELRQLCYLISEGQYKECSGDILIEILKFKCYVPVNKFPLTSRGTYSTSIENVFRPILLEAERNEQKEPENSDRIIRLINAYINYSKAKTYRESMNKKIGLMDRSDAIDYQGNKLCTIHGTYEKQSTGRYYTKNDNFISWNKKAVRNFTVPKGYFLVWADFGQIDLRVAMNLILYKDSQEMKESTLDDKYEAFARAMYLKAGKEFNYDKFKANRPAYKQSILSRMYGANKLSLLGNGFTDMEEVNELDNFFVKAKYYNEIRNSFVSAINFREDMEIYDYFGESRLLDVKYSRETDNHLLKAAFNTPIQSTSNSILMLWTIWLVDEFRKLGFNSDKFRPYLMRHDEGVFLCHESIKPYLYLFKQCSSVSIDDWTELITEVNMGYNYKVSDEELLKEYEENIAQNKDKIIPFSIGKPSNREFYPIKRVFYCYSLAPFSPDKVVLELFRNSSEFAIEIEELENLTRKNKTEAIKLGTDVIHYYLEHINEFEDRKYEVFLKTYLEVGKLFYITDSSSQVYRKFFTPTELSQYLKENRIGYIIVQNSLKNDYFLKGDYRWKYKKGTEYDCYKFILAPDGSYVPEVVEKLNTGEISWT
jgi:hypothetical protein